MAWSCLHTQNTRTLVPEQSHPKRRRFARRKLNYVCSRWGWLHSTNAELNYLIILIKSFARFSKRRKQSDLIGRIFVNWAISIGQFLQKLQKESKCSATYFNSKNYVLFLTIHGLGYNLGDIFANLSGRPGQENYPVYIVGRKWNLLQQRPSQGFLLENLFSGTILTLSSRKVGRKRNLLLQRPT
jgi:hypothetical protein